MLELLIFMEKLKKIDAQEALVMLGEVTQLDRPPQFN